MAGKQLALPTALRRRERMARRRDKRNPVLLEMAH